MDQPTDPGRPPSVADEHEQPTLVDARAVRPLSSSDDRASAPAPQPTTPMPPLTRLGEYELLREIGRGGMGVVFQAKHVRLGRIVALKMILGGVLAPTEDLQRFDTEVAAAAKLQHPGIVALYEVGTHEQQPYFSMEYVSGSSLAQRLGQGPMTNRRAVGYLEMVARAVHHAHVRGIIHRDLKPANVLLDEHDQPKVTDFGLAKLLATDGGQTRTGAVLGTPSYMAPEQAAGRRDIGPACDVWSLGAILYELLTGRPPFRGETAMATLQQVADVDPVSPRLFDPNIDRDLETICLKCLEKEPARRYATAEALADDLRRFLDDDSIAARRIGAVGRAVKWCQRKPAQALVATVGLLVAVGFAVFMILAQGEERRLRNEAEQAQRLATVREEAMRHLLYLAEMRRAQQALEEADFDRVQRLVKHWEPREGKHDLRDWEWHFLKAQSEGRYSFHAHPYQATAVAWRPDGKQFASSGGEPNKPGEIKLWDTATGKLIATLPGHKLAITSLAWHPHKNILVSGGFDRTVRLWDAATSKELAALTGARGAVTSVAFSALGDHLAAASRDKTIRLWRVEEVLAGNGAAKTLTGHDGDVTAVAFAPDGHQLASASADKTVRLWDLATWTERHRLLGHEGPVECLGFNADGALLASGGGQGFQRGEVKLWNPLTGHLLATRFGLSDRITALACSGSGLVAAASSDGLVRLWNQAQTSEAITFRGDKQILGLGFSPEGHKLAVAGTSGRISLFNSSGRLESLRLAAPTAVEAIAFHPVGSVVAAAGRNGALNVWKLDQPDQPIALAGQSGNVTSAAFAPNGALLASGSESGAILVHDFLDPAKQPTHLTGHGGMIRALAFAPDSSFLASASDDDTVRLWDLHTSMPRRVLLHGNGVRALALSADGRWLAAGGGDKFVYLWDVNTGAATKLAGHTGTVNALAFSPDGQQLISGSSDRTIRIWNVDAHKEVSSLESLSAAVLSLAYHPGGRRFASLGQDKIIRLWDVITSQEILELDDPTGAPRALAFSRDGRWLGAASGHAVRVWDSGQTSIGNGH